MAKAIWYPKANRTAQNFSTKYPGVTFDRVEKVLLHTTETPGGWPSYGGGASAPNLTYDPWKHEWRHHFRLNQSARALRDPAGTSVKENRDFVVQVEISCYCDPSLYRKYGHSVNNLDDRALRDLGDFIKFMHNEWGVPLKTPALWFPYPKSAWADSEARMTGPEYDAFRGVLGHQHASGNTHGDPGSLNIKAIMNYAASGVVGKELFTVGQYETLKAEVDTLEENLAYVSKQAKSLAAGIRELAEALLKNDPAAIKAVTDALSGK